MIDARLMKHTLVTLNQKLRSGSLGLRARPYQVYILDQMEDRDCDEVVNASKAIQTIDVIPWPSTNCVIIAPTIVSEIDYKPYWFYMRGEESGNSIILGICTYKDGQPDCIVSRVGLVHEARPIVEDDEDKTLLGNHSFDVNNLNSWTKIMSECDSGWSVVWNSDKRSRFFGAAFSRHLASLACPTGYFVKTDFGKFGTASCRRTFCESPILSMISAERLWTISKSKTADGDQPPKHVSGHFRHLYKLSGLNRSEPRTLAERLQLVVAGKLRRIYISEYWTGNRKFTHEGINYEIDDSERELGAAPEIALKRLTS